MLYQLHFGRNILEQMSNVVSCNITIHGTAATGKFPPLAPNTCHLYTRSQVDFKIKLLMLHEKHKHMCFIRSMGSIRSTFTTPPQRDNYPQRYPGLWNRGFQILGFCLLFFVVLCSSLFFFGFLRCSCLFSVFL